MTAPTQSQEKAMLALTPQPFDTDLPLDQQLTALRRLVTQLEEQGQQRRSSSTAQARQAEQAFRGHLKTCRQRLHAWLVAETAAPSVSSDPARDRFYDAYTDLKQALASWLECETDGDKRALARACADILED